MSIDARLNAVRHILADTDLDAILVTNPANRRYLTGFTAEDHAADESSGVVLITRETATLLVSPTNLPWAQAETDTEHVAVVPSPGFDTAEVGRRLHDLGARQVAVEDATTPAAMWFELQDALGEDVEIVRAA